ncbi:MAG: hypothetical protein ACK5BV_01835 [Bacteroidota bacterium]
MIDQIRNNIDNPSVLEQLYRTNRSDFKNAFHLLYDELKQHPATPVWHARLNFEKQPAAAPTKTNEIWVVVLLSLFAGLIAKIPAMADIKEPDQFYPYNLSFIVFPSLIIYFIWKHRPGIKTALFPLAMLVLSVVFMNFLPKNLKNDAIILSCLHMPLFLWLVTGYSYLGKEIFSTEKRIDYLRHNGDIIIVANVIALAGGVFSGVTIGLFNLININIEQFYLEYIVIFGAAATPLVSSYLVHANPMLVQKISPIIARIFTPIVFLMLLIYLIMVVYTQKDPYNDREFLILFNALLVGVMAIIFFSLSDATKKGWRNFHLIVLFALSVLTLFVDAIVMSAILFRISEWGITPNRAAVLGESSLIFINLCMVSMRILNVVRKKCDAYSVEKAIGDFLPFYAIWFAIVAFLFPLIF